MACLFNPVPCLEGGLWSLVGTVPGWLWIVLGIAAVGVIWRFAGWPGIVALAGAIGFMFGRKSNMPDKDKSDTTDSIKPTRKPRPTIFRRTAKRTPGKRTFNIDTGKWE